MAFWSSTNLLGVTAAAEDDHAEDLVANVEGGRLRPAFFDDTGDITPEGVGQPVFPHRRVLSASDLEVDGIDARPFHRD
jgi:hypothetical protein